MTDSTAVLETAVGTANGSATAGSAPTPTRTSSTSATRPTSAKRPGMYIGDTGTKGLHHLVYELVYNCVDEALAGFCQAHPRDRARGRLDQRRRRRPRHPRRHPYEDTGRSTLEVVLTDVGAGGKFDSGAYKVSAGLHGIGRQGRHRPVRVDRGPGPPQRPGLHAGVRARQGDQRAQGHRRRRRPRPARPSRSSPTRRSSTTPPSTTTRSKTASASWPSSTRAWPSPCSTSAPARRTRSTTTAASPSSSPTSTATRRRIHPRHLRGQDGRRTSASRWRCNTPPARRSAAGLRQQRLQPRRRHAPVRLPRRRHARAERLRQQAGDVQERHADRRGLPRGADRHRQRPGARAAVRVADEDPAEQPRGRRARLQRRARVPGQVPGGEPEGSQADHEEGDPGRRGPRGGDQGEEGAQGPQEHPLAAAACRAS